MKIQAFIFTILYFCASISLAESAEYAVVRTPAPVLNTPGFVSVFGGNSGRELKADRCGQVRELEYIALPGTRLTIVKKIRSGTTDIFQVVTDEYSAAPGTSLYVDGRFLAFGQTLPEPRRVTLPPRENIIASLRAEVGNSYVWGGNMPEGVPELAEWFYRGVRSDDVARLTLAGLDCSGLLYHATGGWTPRNTSQLVGYGKGVAVAGKQPAEIAALLEPLDLIVWNGHVVIVLDRQTTIESRLVCGSPGNGGVVMTPLVQRIGEVMRTRRPVNAWPAGKKRNDIFVVRRWYGGQ
jgi:hypothetical protein